MQLLNTLYVTTPESYVHLDNETVRVEVEHETRLRVPLHHLGSVVCFGHVQLSLPLMHKLADNGIALVLLDANGRFKARLEGAVGGNVLLRQAQYRAAQDSSLARSVARNCIAGKIKNARQVILRGARESKSTEDAATLSRVGDDLAASYQGIVQVQVDRFADLPRSVRALRDHRPIGVVAHARRVLHRPEAVLVGDRAL